jgi:hypothetical protein
VTTACATMPPHCLAPAEADARRRNSAASGWVVGADAAFAPPLLCAASPVCDGPDCDGVDPRLLRRRGVVGLPPGVRAELPRWEALARDRDVVAAREEVAPEAQEVAAAGGGVGHASDRVPSLAARESGR